MGTNKTSQLFALFMMLAAHFGYSEDEVIELVFSVWELPRSEQAGAYRRGIEAMLGVR